MINLKIYGCSNDKLLKKCLSRASVYFLNQLLPNKRNIDIIVKIVNNLVKKEKAYGECYNYSNKINPSKYIIQLNADMSPYETIRTLAHEMVHVKQFDKRELVFFSKHTKWKKERFEKDIVYTSEYPWEYEAEHLEKKLTLSFRKHHIEFDAYIGNIYNLK